VPLLEPPGSRSSACIFSFRRFFDEKPNQEVAKSGTTGQMIAPASFSLTIAVASCCGI
jgi:hypothetical protein